MSEMTFDVWVARQGGVGYVRAHRPHSGPHSNCCPHHDEGARAVAHSSEKELVHYSCRIFIFIEYEFTKRFLTKNWFLIRDTQTMSLEGAHHDGLRRPPRDRHQGLLWVCRIGEISTNPPTDSPRSEGDSKVPILKTINHQNFGVR